MCEHQNFNARVEVHRISKVEGGPIEQFNADAGAVTGAAVRCFTPQLARIALLIADRRALSYRQIGELLTPKIEERTVKMHVKAMSEYFDGDTHDAYPPRIQILVWVRQLEWELGREPTLEEIIRASSQRDV